MRKVLFIVNPASAGGRTLARWNEILPKIEGANIAFDVKFTESCGCGIGFAKKAAIAGGYDVIVSVGGDGTANEVVNGLLGVGLSPGELPAFTILPSGTGSDSVRTLGIPKNVDDFLRMIAANDSKPVDVGEVNFVVGDRKRSRYFLNACDVGIGGTVANTVNRMNQGNVKKSGKGKYFRSIMEQVFKFKAFDAAYVADGKKYEIRKTVIIAVCNGMFFGGGVKISPVSKMDDGVLELFATNHVSKLGLLGLVSKVYTGSHVDHPKVKFQRSEKFEIELERPQLLETDGEVQGYVRSVGFTVHPQAINILC